jgi:hypothetical protein
MTYTGVTSGDFVHPQPIGPGQYLGGNGDGPATVYTEFSTEPTYGPPLYELSFNSKGGRTEKLKWKPGKFLIQSPGVASGIVLYSVNAVPSGFLYTVSFEIEPF